MTAPDANLPGMIGRHPRMRAVYRLVRKVASASLPVVIEGETGTGKELVARALHGLSPWSDGPFVDINCAALPESLAEAELFGWERGAFTGAHAANVGLLETADGGTLFLDEACSLEPAVQAKLLRAIEHQTFRRVGARRMRRSRFRVVAAVPGPLDDFVRQGQFREDLAHRLAGVIVTLPPLRDRGHDLRLLASAFAASPLDDDALDVMAGYGWPGNIRELRALLARVDLLVDSERTTARDILRHLPDSRDLSRENIERALVATNWKVRSAAAVLGVGKTKLYALMKEHGLGLAEASA